MIRHSDSSDSLDSRTSTYQKIKKILPNIRENFFVGDYTRLRMRAIAPRETSAAMINMIAVSGPVFVFVI
jgi:hypothetical protein